MKWFGDFADPENFVLLGQNESQDGLRTFWGAASRVTASITTPKWGETVAGIVGISVHAGLANVPLVYEVGGFRGLVSSGMADVSWDTRTESNGLRYLGFNVRHPISGEILSSTSLPVTVNNAGPVKVFITQPHAGAPVSGTTWVVLWVEGTSGASNVFTLSTPSGVIGTKTTSSRGPVSIPWNTKSLVTGSSS
jgi:hypothetical protein